MSMMTTAQSSIAADLDAFAEASWFTSAYMIAMSSITPLAGRLSQIFTPRLYVVFSTTLLAIGLFISAAAPTLAVFLLGRAVAGCGSGGLMSTSIILVLDMVSKKRRGLCIGLINCGYTTGVASGAVIAGLLAPTLGWRVIFWVQAPIALLLGPLLFFAIPRPSGDDANPFKPEYLLPNLARVDYVGAMTLTISVVLLLTSLASPQIIVWPILVSLPFFALFVVAESRWTTEPIIPVKILRARGVMFTCLAGLGLMMARWSILFFTPVYAMAVRGWSPASAGLFLIPTNAGFGVGGLLVGWLHIRQTGSYYISSLIIFVGFALASLVLSFLSTPESPVALYFSVIFLNGLFAGALMNYTLSHLLHLTSPAVHYIVTALLAMSRGFAGSFGSAVGGGYFARILKPSLEAGFAAHGLPPQPELVRELLGSPATVMRLTGTERLIATESYEHAVQMLFLAGSVLALVSTVVQAGVGWTPETDTGNGDSEVQD
ncbi:hypothetical protein PENARI_c016G06021 [Penicillium arizonense]|uniref:Major facilitator superfamily (MFS) profile domain-containing protein n=1 Tax=Penicillium arizonense TaxID=1835702 RepID=A0A1F5LB78_PENAI|nr:hypothetical protein PENARI_c016G06021 [Penicillium arizonense]OGE50483.1 hypothetical protein PENARI_c016G06021 [Penicillium arizonense]